MRGTPTYDLQEIQRLVAAGPGSYRITDAARMGAAGLKCREPEILDGVRSLRPEHFYKSMESEQLDGYWQDVYRLPFAGSLVYLKVQIYRNRAVVIQFKRK